MMSESFIELAHRLNMTHCEAIPDAMSMVRAFLESPLVSCQERLELIGWLTENVWQHCRRTGPDASRCKCWNDE